MFCENVGIPMNKTYVFRNFFVVKTAKLSSVVQSGEDRNQPCKKEATTGFVSFFNLLDF